MAVTLVTLSFACVFLVLCVASPTRRQFVPETTSSVPVVTSDGEVWDDSDEFDLDGDENWLGESAAALPSSVPLRPEYEDYDDDGDSSSKRGAADDDVEVQDAEEDEDVDDDVLQDRRNSAEFLFLPSTDRRLMLQDDDGDQSGLIKVRHTGKNSYSEVESNSLEEESPKDEDDGQFEFTIGDDDDDEKNEDFEKDDFVLEDSRAKESDSVGEIPRPVTRDDEDDNDEGDDDEEDPVFESPEEDSQVIYGDHVFLY